ncbi:MAG: tetratricopeptide repeat protein, partial [Candidatus Rokubacteria bacterium]|nr:tetratricopeptide repeat protein [Candidatus Rokubacteria bacterium]
MTRVLALAALWLAVTAAPPPPLKPPPPDLTPLIAFAKAPLEKPPVPLPEVAPLAPPALMPPLPPATIVVPGADKPTAFLPPPRTLPCVGAWLRIASESLECGRARFGRGDYEDAAKALDQAMRGATASDRDLLDESRYWLAEALYRLDRIEQADWLFRQVAKDARTAEPGPWALHSSGWTALRLRDVARARDTFAQVLAAAHPASIDGFTRHGLALALYALGQYKDAQQTWAELIARGVPAPLERDVAFWNGETLGRIGQFAQGAQALARFAQNAAGHPLLETSVLRRGWWALGANDVPGSLAAFRSYLGRPAAPGAGSDERPWAEAGMALALLSSGDAAGAQSFVQALDAQRSPLALPVWLSLVVSAVEAKRFADAQGMMQQLLAGSLQPPVRAWLLAMRGDAARQDGNRDEARTQYDLARQADAASAVGRYATYRLAQSNFELREFAQAVNDVTPLAGVTLSPDLLLAALLLQGDAAYYAGNFPVAAAAYRRALLEIPGQPSAALVRLSAAWAALKQNQNAEARRQFLDFATATPTDPYAIDAMLLASELTILATELDAARDLLDRILATYPTHPRTDFARMNRALLMMRGGQSPLAVPLMRDWLKRAPYSPLSPRAHAILGAALLNSGVPAEAGKEFTLARGEGLGALAGLGLGAVAPVEGRLDEATRELNEA